MTVTVTNSTLFYALRHSSNAPPPHHRCSTHHPRTGLGPIRPQCHTTTFKSRQAHKFILYAKQMDPRRQKFLRASRRRIANLPLGVTGLLREADGQLEGYTIQSTSKSSDAAGPGGERLLDQPTCPQGPGGRERGKPAGWPPTGQPDRRELPRTSRNPRPDRTPTPLHDADPI